MLKNSSVAILGGFSDTITLMRQLGATILIVASANDLTLEDVGKLSWVLAQYKNILS